MADINQTLKKLNLYKTNPSLVKDVSPNELADLVILVLKQVAVIETAIKEGRLDGYTPQAGKDYLGKPEALTMLTNAVNDAVRDFDGKMAEKGSQLEIQVLKALENIRSGDDGIVTEAEIQRAAEMAYSLIELPDFAAMIPEAITADISAVRDGLELLIGDNRLQLEITDVKGLEESLQQLSQVRAGTGGGGIGKNQVYGFIRQAIADGTISVGGSSLPDQTGNSGKFLGTDGTDATWESIPGGGDMLGSNNLSDVANAGAARTNLGLGTAAVAATGDFATAAQGTLAASAQQPPSEGAFVNGDKTKLDTYSEANQTDNNAKISFDSTASTKVGHITVTQAVNLDTMESDIAALANGMVYKGDWDASAGTFPGSAAAQTGWFYYVSVAGTVDSVAFAVGDNIVAVTDNASTSTFDSNWSKHDQTDAVQSVVGITGSVSKSGLLSALNVADGATPDQDLSALAPIANPTFTGEIGIGSVNVSETELGILEGLTASTAELNKMDGVTATTAEINFVDGVTSNVQTQLNAKAEDAADVGLGNVDNTSNATERAATATLTNKRITRREQTVASASTVTPHWDNDDIVTITAQAVGLTLANPAGTPTDGQPMVIRILDNATGRTIAVGSQYRAIGVTIPTTTTASKTIYLGGFWNVADSKFDITAVAEET